MGRRSKEHTYVKYILILDTSGNVGKRFELDSKGKLKNSLVPSGQIRQRQKQKIHTINSIPFPQVMTSPISVQQQPQQKQTDNDNSNNNNLVKFDFPITPMMRGKPALFWNQKVMINA